jgi:hypothetical protein
MNSPGCVSRAAPVLLGGFSFLPHQIGSNFVQPAELYLTFLDFNIKIALAETQNRRGCDE